MFGHQYSHVWVDFRGIRDPWLRAHDIDLFENSRRATRAQRNYAIANPKGWAGYGEDIWGLTACDGPGDFKTVDRRRRARVLQLFGARARRARRRHARADRARRRRSRSSRELVSEALAAMHRRYGAAIYGQYGFLDSFNPTLRRAGAGKPLLHGRIVAGPVLGRRRLSRHRPGADRGDDRQPSRRFRVEADARSAPVVDGLRRAGFTGGWLGPRMMLTRRALVAGHGGAAVRCRRAARAARDERARHVGDGRGGGEFARACSPRLPGGAPSDLRIQPLPWSAAHEKLLTGFAGGSLPDLGPGRQ